MVTVLVGGQFGSEGKGLIAGHIAEDHGVHVRVGAANAGHTLYVDGYKHVLQQLPCAAYANPEAVLVLGAGALITPTILRREIAENVEWRERNHKAPLVLYVDEKAQVIQQHHVDEEALSDLAKRIGSTSTIAREGIGVAQASKVLRRENCVQFKSLGWAESPPLGMRGLEVTDTADFLHDVMPQMNILLEGTQGTGLSLTHGHFPYVTSRDITASAIAADCGFGPRDIDCVLMVCRTFPIRVHGNSGPFWEGSEEIDFEDIGVSPERTTVTKLKRRIATFSMEQVRTAARLNSVSHIALTFCDYLAPSLAEQTVFDYTAPDQHKVTELVRGIEYACQAPVLYLGTGPKTLVERYEHWFGSETSMGMSRVL